MKRDEKLTFAPEGIKNKRSLPGYVALIVVAAVIFGAISFVVILAYNDFDIQKAIGARRPDSSSTTEEQESSLEAVKALNEVTLQDFSGSVNFLFICADDKKLNFCNVVSVTPAENKIRVKPVAPDFSLPSAGGSMALSDMLETFSLKDICEAFSAKSIPVSRYIMVSEDNFLRLLQTLGPVELVLDTEYNFNVDAIKYTFFSGTQSVTADYLLKLIKYAASGEEQLRLQAQTAASVIRTHFSLQNLDKGEDFFAKLINLVDSDITVFDYTASLDILKSMISQGAQVSAVT